MNKVVQKQQVVGSDPGQSLAIVSVILSFVGFSLIGIVLGFIARSQSKKAGFNNALALVGIIVGFIFTIIGTLIFVAIVIASFNGAQSKADDSLSVSRANQLHSSLEEFYVDNEYYPNEVFEYMFPGMSESTLTHANGVRIVSSRDNVQSVDEAFNLPSPDRDSPYQYIGFDCVGSKCKGYVIKIKIDNINKKISNLNYYYLTGIMNP